MRKDVSLRQYNEFRLVREMGWTYDELERTPQYRIEEALTFLGIEAEVREVKGG